MEFTTVLFYAFSTILVLAALRVVTERNPVHAALFLVLSFFSAASIWMLLKAEFLAIALVLVYVGAVMVLFLFVVMMADIDVNKLREGFWRHLPVAATVGLLIIAEMGLILYSSFKGVGPDVPAASASQGGTRELGQVIYTQYVFAFEIAALILLVGMVAAVALTLRRRKDTRYFNPGKALNVKASERVRIVKMKSETEPPAGAPGNAEQTGAVQAASDKQ